MFYCDAFVMYNTLCSVSGTLYVHVCNTIRNVMQKLNPSILASVLHCTFFITCCTCEHLQCTQTVYMYMYNVIIVCTCVVQIVFVLVV